jgi:hypothetical protein
VNPVSTAFGSARLGFYRYSLKVSSAACCFASAACRLASATCCLLHWFKKDALLRHRLAEHFVFGLEELDLLLEVVDCGTSQPKQQRVEDVDHPGKMLPNLGENCDVAIFLYTGGSGRRLQSR